MNDDLLWFLTMETAAAAAATTEEWWLPDTLEVDCSPPGLDETCGRGEGGTWLTVCTMVAPDSVLVTCRDVEIQ